MRAGSHSSLGSSRNGAPHFRLGLITAVNVIKTVPPQTRSQTNLIIWKCVTFTIKTKSDYRLKTPVLCWGAFWIWVWWAVYWDSLNTRCHHLVLTWVLKGREISVPFCQSEHSGTWRKVRTSLTFYSLVNVVQTTAQALSPETKMQSLSKMSQEIEIQLWAFWVFLPVTHQLWLSFSVCLVTSERNGKQRPESSCYKNSLEERKNSRGITARQSC